jgi:hypothetical protein
LIFITLGCRKGHHHHLPLSVRSVDFNHNFPSFFSVHFLFGAGQSTRKSALLSAAKKAKLKTNPSRVRFAEGVVINGTPPLPLVTFFWSSFVAGSK